MKTTSSLSILAAISLLASCASNPAAPKPEPPPKDPTASWIKGTLTCLDDGAVLPFRIQKKWAWGGSASGGVAATHPATGERFQGQYTALLQASRSHATIYSGGQWAYANTHQTSRNANTIASLTGDRGTVIHIQMEILAGWSPHGIGTGRDNTNRHYQVQF